MNSETYQQKYADNNSLPKKQSIIIDSICIALILLFMYAAVSKLLDMQKFHVQVNQSPMLTSFSSIIIWIIPLSEIAISLMLALNKFKLIGLYLSFTIMSLFTSYIIIIQNFSEYIPCSCGGILQNMSWTQHLYFNIFFTLIAMLGILTESKLAREKRLKSINT